MTHIERRLQETPASKREKVGEKLLLKKIGQAISDYDMIRPGDKICVGVSGGQDSLTLLRVLTSRALTTSLKYTVIAVHVETDYSGNAKKQKNILQKMFKKIGVEYYFKKASVLKSSKRDKVSCFWCSWNRRRELFKVCEKLKCNKIAFGHHKDDIIETTLMNLFFNGVIATMNPKQPMFGGKVSIIRPLSYLEKASVKAFAKACGIPEQASTCKNSDLSKRRLVNSIIKETSKKTKAVKSNIFFAPTRIQEGYLGEQEKGVL